MTVTEKKFDGFKERMLARQEKISLLLTNKSVVFKKENIMEIIKPMNANQK